MKGHTKEITGLNLSNDGRLVASVCKAGVIKLFDMRAMYKELCSLSDPEFQNTALSFNRLTFSPCMSFVVAGSMNGTVLVWDLGTGCVEKKLKGHVNPIVGCDWSKDGSRLVSASSDKKVILWQ